MSGVGTTTISASATPAVLAVLTYRLLRPLALGDVARLAEDSLSVLKINQPGADVNRYMPCVLVVPEALLYSSAKNSNRSVHHAFPLRRLRVDEMLARVGGGVGPGFGHNHGDVVEVVPDDAITVSRQVDAGIVELDGGNVKNSVYRDCSTTGKIGGCSGPG